MASQGLLDKRTSHSLPLAYLTIAPRTGYRKWSRSGRTTSPTLIAELERASIMATLRSQLDVPRRLVPGVAVCWQLQAFVGSGEQDIYDFLRGELVGFGQRLAKGIVLGRAHGQESCLDYANRYSTKPETAAKQAVLVASEVLSGWPPATSPNR